MNPTIDDFSTPGFIADAAPRHDSDTDATPRHGRGAGPVRDGAGAGRRGVGNPASTKTRPRRRNWSGGQRFRPAGLHRPRSEEELAALLERIRARGGRAKLVGAAHSFSGLAHTTGELISIDALSGVIAVDRENMEVTFGAGTRLRDVPALLRPYGLALANQGDVDPQSLAGAVATGTHGTGLALTGLAGMVRGLRLITADGAVRDARAGDEIFELGRINLGALGAVTRLTMSVVDTFLLSAVERAEPLAPVRDNLPELARQVDHLEYYWFPGTGVAHVKRNTRHRPGARDLPKSLPRWRRLVDDELAGNGVFGAMCALGHATPAVTGALNRLSARFLAQREYSGAAHDVFVSPRRVRFNEMEYAVALADAPEVLREVHARLNSCRLPVTFPIEVRVAAGDDVPLSTAKGRDSCYIAVHRYHRDNARELFARVEPVLVAAGGRPHWGKMHTLDHDRLAAVHEDLPAVAQLRERLDPDGVFRNREIDRVFALG